MRAGVTTGMSGPTVVRRAILMEWTPPPDGIAMCQSGVEVQRPEGGDIPGKGYRHRDRSGEAQLSASRRPGGWIGSVPHEAVPDPAAERGSVHYGLASRDTTKRTHSILCALAMMAGQLGKGLRALSHRPFTIQAAPNAHMATASSARSTWSGRYSMMVRITIVKVLEIINQPQIM